MKTMLLRAALLLALLIAPLPAIADQSSLCVATTGTVSGLTVVQGFNAGLKALVTANSGTSAPTNECGGAAILGQTWLDTSTTPYVLKMYDGTSWQVLGSVDTSSHLWTPPVGGGATTLASATTTSLWSVAPAYITISGTTAITGFGSGAVTGTIKVITFSGALTLTHNATSLILPTGTNITTAAGDSALVVSLGGSNAKVVAYTKADGSSLLGNSTLSANVVFSGAITPTALSGTTNDWAPTGLATASTIRASASADRSLTGISAQPDGTLLTLINVSASAKITLASQSASSSASNRFDLGGVDMILGPQSAVLLRYDGTTSRWDAIAAKQNAASSAGAVAGTDNSTLMTPLRTAEAFASAIATENSGTYRYVRTVTYTASGSYTPGSKAERLHVRMVAGGGGGGGADTTDSDSAQGSGGGGGGQGMEFWINVSSISAPVTVTVGSGGNGGSSAGGNGSSGSDTTFGSYATVDGGAGGGGDASGFYVGGEGGAGGNSNGTLPSGGIRFDGQGGAFGLGVNGSNINGATTGANDAVGGSGGAGGLLGGSGGAGIYETLSGVSNGAAAPADGRGGGGGGAVSLNGAGGATGGAGADGIVIIEEYTVDN